VAKENDLKCMIEHAKKLQNNMENQFGAKERVKRK